MSVRNTKANLLTYTKVIVLGAILTVSWMIYKTYAPISAYKTNALLSFSHENCDDIKTEIYYDKKITQAEYEDFFELCKDRREEIQTNIMQAISKRGQ